MTSSHLLILLCVLIMVSGFFSGSETALMAINRYRLRHMARQNNRKAQRLSKMLERPDRILSLILIGNTYVNLQAAAIATVVAVQAYGPTGVSIATVLLTIVVLLFAEVMPKTLASAYPQKFAFIAVYPLTILMKLLYPAVYLTNITAVGFLKLLGVRVGRSNLEHLSSEELRTVVHEAGSRMPRSHQDMVLSVLDLGKVSVNDIMIPRSEIVGVDLNEDWNVILNQLTRSHYTRLPVYRDNIDHIVGILHMRAALRLLAEDQLDKSTLLTATRAVYFVPESTPLSTQLLNFRKQKRRTALVVDEYGEIQGLVTLEDILEEIVGEFTTDIVDALKQIKAEADGGFILEGAVNLRELNKSMGWALPIDGPKTLSGLIVEYLEFIPQTGTGMRINNYAIEVLTVKGNRIKQAKIFPPLASGSAEQQPPAAPQTPKH